MYTNLSSSFLSRIDREELLSLSQILGLRHPDLLMSHGTYIYIYINNPLLPYLSALSPNVLLSFEAINYMDP